MVNDHNHSFGEKDYNEIKEDYEMSKQCQSCGMPLRTKTAGDCRGTEADGSKSEKWCSLCYENGAFIQPDTTLEEMKTIVDNALVEQGSGRIMRWLAQRQLAQLERWKVK